MTGNFEVLCVIELSPDVHDGFAIFLRNFLEDSKSPSRSQIVVSVVKHQFKTSQQVQLHVSCDQRELLKIADYVDLKKKCKDGSLQVFCADKLSYFENSDDLQQFFTKAEKQWLVLHHLQSIKVTDDGFTVPDHPQLKLRVGSSLLNQCINAGLISQVFPLHDSELSTLEYQWLKRNPFLGQLPLSEIRRYYGVMIAFYFAFLEYYSSALFLPALVGVVYFIFQFHKINFEGLIVLAIFNILWSTAFLEGWKRKSNTLAYIWGTYDMRLVEEARPNYHGDMGRNPVTDKEEPLYPKWKRMLRFYCISIPIVILCLSVSLAAMRVYIESENWMLEWYNGQEEHGYYELAVSFVPTVVYSLAIIIMNQLYKPIAIKLNEQENHRLQSTFDNHLTIKLVSFWFINTYILMFYTAFIQQDLDALRKTVLTELIVTQLVDQLQETVVPYLMYKYRKRGLSYAVDGVQTSVLGLKESKKDLYEGTFDDYLELFIQFGYVTLFSCVAPLAAVLSLVNNIMEQYTDALKLCRVYQRPFSRPVVGIGAWQTVFELMGYLAIITNSALIGLCVYQGNLRPQSTDIQLLLLIVGIEHVFIGLRVLVAYVIPDQAKWLEIALARDAYKMKTMALSHQELHNSTKKKD